jgi:hypothetical protein
VNEERRSKDPSRKADGGRSKHRAQVKEWNPNDALDHGGGRWLSRQLILAMLEL